MSLVSNDQCTLMIWHLDPLWLMNEKACREFYRHLFPPPARRSIEGAHAISEVEGNLSGAAWIAFADLIPHSYVPFDIRKMAWGIRRNLKDMLDGVDRMKPLELPMEASGLVGDTTGGAPTAESGLSVSGVCRQCFHEAVEDATPAQRETINLFTNEDDYQRDSKKGRGLNSILTESQSRTFRRWKEQYLSNSQNCSHNQ